MARHNYSFEKRQRELAKKKKKEDKLQEKNLRKASRGPAAEAGTAASTPEADNGDVPAPAGHAGVATPDS